MNKNRDYRTLLYVRAKLYSMELGAGNTWNPATQHYIPIVLIEERKSNTYIMYGVNRGKIVVNVRINQNSWFNKMTTFFGSLKNSDTRQHVGMAFPPDGSIESFRITLEEIKKQLLTIPSLRRTLKAITITAAKYSYAPIASVVEAALAKERFPTVPKPKDDTDWIQQQIANGNFVLPHHPLANKPNAHTKGDTIQNPNSKALTGISVRNGGFSEGQRPALKNSPAIIKKRAVEDRKMNEEFLQETVAVEAITGKDETNKGKAQTLMWQKRLAKIEGPEVKGHKIRHEMGPQPQIPFLTVHKKENDLKNLRLENGIGDYIRALQALQQEHDDLEVKITSLKKERQDMQQNIFNLSTGLSSYVTGLIKTDQIPFKNLEKTLFGLSDNQADQPREDQHQDPVSMAAERLRARRIELEERAASISSEVKFIGMSVAGMKR